jgi:hypothetical protein
MAFFYSFFPQTILNFRSVEIDLQKIFTDEKYHYFFVVITDFFLMHH